MIVETVVGFSASSVQLFYSHSYSKKIQIGHELKKPSTNPASQV